MEGLEPPASSGGEVAGEIAAAVADGTLAASGVACGRGDSLCKRSEISRHQTRMSSDPCAIIQDTEDNREVLDRNLWLPKYRKEQCQNSAYTSCGNYANRFGPTQVRRESFLRGLGQVTSSKSCKDGFLNYLPEDLFPQTKKEATTVSAQRPDMTLYAQNTKVKRSCGSISEIDVERRLRPLPGVYAGAFVPVFPKEGKPGLVPNFIVDNYGPDARKGTAYGMGRETDKGANYGMGRATRGEKYTNGTSFGKHKYPSWDDLKRNHDQMMD